MFDELIMVRPDLVDGEKDWYWLKHDTGAWDGPVEDWETSHKIKYMKYLKAKDVVVTAGGNQGLYSRLYSNYFKNVYVFEPDPINFHCLALNNQRENIIKVNCGLGSIASFLTLVRPVADNTGINQFINQPGPIPVLPLDSFNFPKVDLLQLDVEGFEYNALLGAVRTINKHRPVIVLERANRPDILGLMQSLNYEVKDTSKMDTIFTSKI